jgi:hypothetical protein
MSDVSEFKTIATAEPQAPGTGTPAIGTSNNISSIAVSRQREANCLE